MHDIDVGQGELLPDAGIDDTLDLLRYVTHDDLPRHVWPQQLANLVDVLVALYRRRGRATDSALEEAREVVFAIAHYIGGKPMYLPKGKSLEAALRHAQIWQAWTGDNGYALAAEYGLTLRQVQNIIAQQMRYRRGLRQAALPFKGE